MECENKDEKQGALGLTLSSADTAVARVTARRTGSAIPRMAEIGRTKREERERERGVCIRERQKKGDLI